MSYRTIMVQMLNDEAIDQRVEASVALARRCDAHLFGVHVVPPPTMPMGYGEAAAYVGPEMIEAQRRSSQEVADRLTECFRRHTEGGTVAASWRVDDGDPATCYAAHARTADLCVVPQLRQSGIDALAPELAEQLIVDAGGPVLMLPRGSGASVGRRVLVGWSGRKESARALRDALPFLEKAEEVELVTVGDATGLFLDEAVEALARHGLRPRGRVVEGRDDAGPALLEQAGTMRADLLVMGAYGHSRLRELIFGGATHHVLEHADLPVLFSC